MSAVAYRILTNWKREDGQTMAEYGLILALVAVAAVGAYFALGGDISSVITNVTGNL